MRAETKPLNVEKVRKDFPLVEEVIYLDNAATSQNPRQVTETVKEFYEETNANIHRGLYRLSEKATREYEDAHRKVADFIGADSWEQVIFVRNTTEAINVVAYSWALEELDDSAEIVLTQMEHHSNLVPWQFVAEETGAELKFIEVDDDGELSADDMADKITGDTALVAATHCSNVLGTVNDVEELTEKAHENGAKMLLDAAQSAPHMPVDVGDKDFLVFSGHKMCGPTGVGVLYAKRDLLEEMDPFLYGGDMISKVTYEDAEWNKLPWKFEAGTPNIAGGIGLGAAVDYLEELGMEKVRAHERELTEYALQKLGDVENLTIYGDPDDRVGVISFNIDGVHPHDLASVLDDDDVCIRAGHHCAQPLMEELGIDAAARASLYLYNTEDDIDQLVESIRDAKKVFEVD